MITNYIFPKFKNISNISMIQTTRLGGVSFGNYASLNLSFDVNDDVLNVKKNISVLEEKIQPIKWIKQEHGLDVIRLPSTKLKGDAVFTNQKNVVCAVRTADCLPILLSNKKGSFVAAIHAGWKSLGSGIIEKTINRINSDSEIYAWLGPCISASNFDVGKDVFEHFLKNDSFTSPAFSKYHNKFKLCLPTAAIIKLQNLGVNNIIGSTLDENYCTFDDHKRFYSFRRDKITGRMASLIWING